MVREYEMTLIARGDLPEGQSAQVFTKYENYMTRDGGEILKRDDWGVRKMAFPMKKVFRGHYVIYDFVTDPANIDEMERLMRIDENVLRYMTLNLTSKVDIEARKAELAKEAAQEKSNQNRADD